jgi:hypothetical protein
MPETSPFYFDWTGQKSFDGACPLGPWIVPAEDLAEPGNLRISLSVNGVVKQNSNEAAPQTDEACGGCGSGRRLMTSFW